MRRSITAVASVVVAFAAVGCSGSGGGSSLASTTTTPVVTTAPAATTTEAPSTTAAPAPTTTTTAALITDATTADPKALAAQLQVVLDRYDELTVESLADPDRPFTDHQFVDELRSVAEDNVIAGLLQRWQELRDQGVAGRLGPSGGHRQVLTSLAEVSSRAVGATYCMYDDGTTYDRSTGGVLDDGVIVRRGVVDFLQQGSTWTISHKETVEESRLASGEANPCLAEHIG